MLSFENDYAEGAHPKILQRLLDTNLEQLPGYGADEYTQSAIEKIRMACHDPYAEIFFLTGGTQANMTVLDALLIGVEAVVAADSGHIAVHEAGAIEFTGHKVITLPQREGKLEADALESYLHAFFSDPTCEHMPQPGAVYISHPTEYGTLYTKKELKALREVSDRYGLSLFLDGARLGYGLMSPGTDVTLPDLSEWTHAFTIGGTKVGALCGEAVVFPGSGVPRSFFTHVKQHGALLAKGRLCGVQFDTLFTDELYFEISRHAISMAQRLKEGFEKRGFRFFLDSPTNQQFLILENGLMERLAHRVRFSLWGPFDANHSVVRFAASWATTREQVDQLMEILDEEGR